MRSIFHIWDIITAIALLYTIFLSPFEAGFLEASIGVEAWRDPWFLANRCLDLIFFVDMVLQFFIAYESVDELGGPTWIEDQRQIVKHYCQTWFFLDAVTIFVPAFFDVQMALTSSAEGGIAEDVSVLRMLRVVRLAKLVRLVRASRIYKRWQSKITLSSGTQTVVTCSVLLVVGAHWYACLIGIVTSMHDNKQDTWLGDSRYGYCAPGSAECDGIGLLTLYIAALTWSVMLITGTGGTDFYPNAASDAETIVVLLMVLNGALLWTYVLALFCDMATNSNPALTNYKQILDSLNYFIRLHRLPVEMARRLREYVHQQKPSQFAKFAEHVIPVLSPALQVETIMLVNKHWLDAVWFLHDVETPCLVRLAREMSCLTLAPGEVAPMHNLYVVTRGLVLYGGRVLRRGMVWGDDILLTNKSNFMSYRARAMTYVDVLMLSKDTLTQVMALFSASHAKLRRKAIFLALSRRLLKMTEVERADKRKAKRDRAMGKRSRTRRMSHQDSFFVKMDASQDASEALGEQQRNGTPGGAPERKGSSALLAIRQVKAGMAKALPKQRRSCASYASERAVRNSAVELSMILHDKQVPQAQWVDGGSKGSHPVADMQHTELVDLLHAISSEVRGLRVEVNELRHGGQAAHGEAPSDRGGGIGCSPPASPPAEECLGADVSARGAASAGGHASACGEAPGGQDRGGDAPSQSVSPALLRARAASSALATDSL